MITLDQPWHRREREESGMDPVGSRSQCVDAVGGLERAGALPNLGPTKMAVVQGRGHGEGNAFPTECEETR